MERKLCCNALQRKDRTSAGIEMAWRNGNKVLCKSKLQICRLHCGKWTWNLVDIFKGRLNNCTPHTKLTHAQYQGSCKGLWLLAFLSPRDTHFTSMWSWPTMTQKHESKPPQNLWKKMYFLLLTATHISALCNLFFLPACSLLLLLAPCR